MHILEHELEDGRFQYVQVERRDNVALYTQTHKASGTVRYEVIKIRIQPEHTWPTGVTTPEKEAYPGSSAWGRDGWTFFALASAQQKTGFQEQSPSCRARHDGVHAEYQIMPSHARISRRGNDFLRSCSA